MPDQLPDLEAALARLDARDRDYWNAEAARAAASAPLADTDCDRDYAEEAAVRADSERENREEQAHADLVAETVRHLRTLSHNTHADAQESVAALAGEVNLRLAPNAHRYELLARQQHVALLAAMVAAELETTGSYDPLRVAEGVSAGYRVTHVARVPADLLNRALRDATARVLDLVREAVAR